MELDVPTDLINKCEMGFREAVGLSSFNRNDTNLPSICTTIESSIATLDPSPSYRRCEYCSGKLLRGLHSLICVYCGEYQTTNPEPISFNSTRGYTWLLQALNFNGLEAVGSLAEGSGINGGQNAGEDEFTISDLLDLKISWQAASKNPKNNINIKTSEHNSSSNLGTPNVDFFIESKRDVVADVSEEQPYADQNKTLEDEESFTSDWNAEFQFADTKMENENLGVPVFDFFTESNRDVVSDAPEEQPVSSKADQNKTYEDQEIFTSDWNAEFQFSDTKIEKQNLESADPYVGADADLSAHMDVVFGQKTDKRPVDDSVPFQDEAHMDFVFGQKTDKRPVDDSDPFQDEAHMDFVFGQKADKRPVDDSYPFQDDLFADMDSVFQAQDGLSDDLNNINLKHTDVDWFSDGNWQASSVNNMDTVKDDNLFQDDDGFDGWNDFTSSTGNQDSWKDNSNEIVGDCENIAELNLFPSTDDSQEVDFGKLLMSDIFSGDNNPSDTHAAYDIFSEISTTSRNAEGPKNDEITPNATRPENDVQMLMSQMHDLSFMLKDELSIPSKPDDLDPFLI